MATIEEFKQRAFPRLRAKVIKEIVWADVVSALQGSNGTKAQIVQALRNEKPGQVGVLIAKQIEALVNQRTNDELDSIVGDGALNLNEFSRIFD